MAAEEKSLDDGEARFIERAIEGGISDEEYRSGMEQKRLDITDSEKAIREAGWHTCGAMAVGDGYSVVMQFRQAHPLVAEYQRRVLVFAGTERQAQLIGALQLRMNFGGRTYIMLYRHLDREGKVTHLSFEAKDESPGTAQFIRLDNPDFESPPGMTDREYFGLVSGQAYPWKYISPVIVSEEEARRKMR